jgi:hypothetical protein
MADNRVQQARAAGYTDQEIFQHLTQGREADLAKAREAGYNDTQILEFFLGRDGSAPVSGVADDELRQRRVDAARQRSATDNAVSEIENDPAMSVGGFERARAGFGKSFVDTGRGLRQIGAETADFVAPRQKTIADLAANRDPSRSAAIQQEIDESRRLDAPLMRSGAGSTGNITGAVAQTVPLMFLPGGATIAGSAAIGAGLGATQPVATGESRAFNTAIGAGAGVAGPVVARAAGATWRLGKSLAEPFTQGGRERVAGRVLGRFGIEPADVAGLTNAPTATGARPTLPSQITRPEGAAGAARLQDAIRTQNPEFAAQLAAREGENNAARVTTLEGLASMNGGRNAAEAARSAQAGKLYEAAKSQVIDPKTLAPAEAEELNKVLNLPAVKQGMTAAAENMANKGMTPGPTTSIEALHEAKLAMDQRISQLAASGSPASSAEGSAIKAAQKRLVNLIEAHSPDYKQARQLYATLSKPLNQSDIAGEVLNRGASNTTDLAGNRRLMPAQLTKAVADEGKLIKNATGRDLGARLEDVLEPDQLAAIRSVIGEVDREGAVARAANGPGSATAQRIASGNVISQTLERTGLPASAADSVTLQEVLGRPLQFLYKGAAEPKLQMTLGELLLNPQAASRAMAAAAPEQRKALATVLSNGYLKQAARAALPASAEANRR